MYLIGGLETFQQTAKQENLEKVHPDVLTTVMNMDKFTLANLVIDMESVPE